MSRPVVLGQCMHQCPAACTSSHDNGTQRRAGRAAQRTWLGPSCLQCAELCHPRRTHILSPRIWTCKPDTASQCRLLAHSIQTTFMCFVSLHGYRLSPPGCCLAKLVALASDKLCRARASQPLVVNLACVWRVALTCRCARGCVQLVASGNTDQYESGLAPSTVPLALAPHQSVECLYCALACMLLFMAITPPSKERSALSHPCTAVHKGLLALCALCFRLTRVCTGTARVPVYFTGTVSLLATSMFQAWMRFRGQADMPGSHCQVPAARRGHCGTALR